MIVESTPLVEVPLRTRRIRFSLLALLLFVTIVCLILGWVMQPRKYVLTCLFQVDAVPPSIFGITESAFNERAFERLHHTQLELLKSDFVLQSALRNPKVAAMPLIQSEKEPISWLRNHLEVDFPADSEVLAIRMHCREDAINDYRAILDSVASAYLNEIVFAEDQTRLVQRDALAKSLSKISAEVESKMDELHNLIKDTGKDSPAVQLRQAALNDLMEVMHRSSIALQYFDMESEAPKRIKEIQPATATKE